jgi:hypothetical protein
MCSIYLSCNPSLTHSLTHYHNRTLDARMQPILERVKTHYKPSSDVGRAPSELEQAYNAFKHSLIHLGVSEGVGDEEKLARAIALGQAAYEHLRTETAGE